MLPLGPSGLTPRLAAFQTFKFPPRRERGLASRSPHVGCDQTFCPPWTSSLFISILQLRGPNPQASPSSPKNENTDILSTHWLTISQEMQDFTAYTMFSFYFCLFTPPLFLTTILCSCQGKFQNLNHTDENKK